MEQILNFLNLFKKQVSRSILVICIITPIIMIIWQSIYVPGYNDLTINEQCEFKTSTSLDCVFCGGTRSVNAFLAKDLVTSAMHNCFFILAFLSCCAYSLTYFLNYNKHDNHIMLAYELFIACMNAAVFHSIYKNYSYNLMTTILALSLLIGTIIFMFMSSILCKCSFIKIMIDITYVYIVIFFSNQLNIIALTDDLRYLTSFTSCVKLLSYLLLIRNLLLIINKIAEYFYKKYHESNN